jgi:hypothetical protein
MKHLDNVLGKAMHVECWTGMTVSPDAEFVQIKSAV